MATEKIYAGIIRDGRPYAGILIGINHNQDEFISSPIELQRFVTLNRDWIIEILEDCDLAFNDEIVVTSRRDDRIDHNEYRYSFDYLSGFLAGFDIDFLGRK